MTPVVIKKNAWIETGAIVLLGVTISEGSVVAADSFITNDVPPHSIIDGVPVAETSPNIRGDYTRMFEFTQTGFSLAWKLDNATDITTGLPDMAHRGALSTASFNRDTMCSLH